MRDTGNKHLLQLIPSEGIREEKEARMATQPTPKYRSAKSGQYVKPSYAKVHPNTTVKETVAKPAKVGKRG